MDVKIAIQKLGSSILFVEVHGEIDLETSLNFEEPMTRLVRKGHHHLLVDLENVEFIDSSGLGILIGLHRLLEGVHGEMSVICSNPNILKLFAITNFAKLVKVFGKREEATVSVCAGRETIAA